LLVADDDACCYYLDYFSLHGSLLLGAAPAKEGLRAWDSGLGMRDSDSSNFQIPSPQSPVPGTQSPVPAALGTEVSSLPIIIEPSPTIHYPLFTTHSDLGGWLLSYAVATLLTGVALLGAWAYKVSHDYQLATIEKNSRGLRGRRCDAEGRRSDHGHGRLPLGRS
jgi:hypothetical protein